MDKLKNWTVEKIGWTSLWRVVSPFFWLIDYEDKEGYMIIAEKDFVCNYGSIPRVLRWIFDPTRYNSYVIHDACYSSQVKYHKKTNEYVPLTRAEADKILLEGITYEWAWFIERFCIYFGVRVFWWIAWNF